MAKELRFDVSALDRASATFVKMAAAVDRFERRLDALDGKKVDVEVDVDTAKAEAKVGKFATDIRRKVQAAADSLPELDITADSSDADRKLMDIRRRMQELADKRIGVDVDADAALAQTKQLKRELDELGRTSPSARVRVDAGTASAQLAAIDAQVDKIDGRTATVKVKTDKSFSNATTDIALLGRSLAQLAIPIGIVAGAPAIASLGQSAKVASGSLLLIPAALTGAGLAAATLGVAFHKFGDAISGDAKKAAKGMAALTPPAREAATAIRSLRPAWDALRLDVQGQMFEGLGQKIRSLGGTYIPVLRTAMSGVASSFNDAATGMADFLARSETVETVRGMFDNLRATIANLTPAATPLLSVFTDLSAVGSGVLRDLTSGAAGAAQSFATFVAQARQSGQLEVWMRRGVDVVKQLGQVAVNTGSILSSIFKAADGAGKPFLTTLVEITAKMRDWAASAQGQMQITRAFESIRNVVTALLPGIQAIGRAIGEIVVNREASGALEALASAFSALVVAAAPVIVTISGMVSRAITPLANALGFLAPVIGPVVGGLLAMKAASSAMSFVAAISGLTALKAAVTGTVGALNTVKAGATGAQAATAGLATAGTTAAGGMRTAATAAAASATATANAGRSASAAGASMRTAASGAQSAATATTAASRSASQAGAGFRAAASGAMSAGAAIGGAGRAAGSAGSQVGEAGSKTAKAGSDAAGAGGKFDGLKGKFDGVRSAGASLAAGLPLIGAALTGLVAAGGAGKSTLSDLDAAMVAGQPAVDGLRQKLSEQNGEWEKSTTVGGMFVNTTNQWIAKNIEGKLTIDELNQKWAEYQQHLTDVANQMGVSGASFNAMRDSTKAADEATSHFGDSLRLIGPALGGIKDGVIPTQELSNALDGLGRDAGTAAQASGEAAMRLGGVEAGAKAAGASMAANRDQFVQAATAAGMTADEANKLADRLGMIPKNAEINFRTNAATAAMEIGQINEKVQAVPPGKSITMTAITDSAKANLESLGFTVTRLPNGTVTVTANTSAAKVNLDLLSAAARRPENKDINLNTLDAHTKARVLSTEASKPEHKQILAETATAQRNVELLGSAARRPENKNINLDTLDAHTKARVLSDEASRQANKPLTLETAQAGTALGAIDQQARNPATKPLLGDPAGALGANAAIVGAVAQPSTKPMLGDNAPGMGANAGLQGAVQVTATKPIAGNNAGGMGSNQALTGAVTTTATKPINGNNAGGMGSNQALTGSVQAPATKPINGNNSGAMSAVAAVVASATRVVTMTINVVKRFFGSEGGIVPAHGFADGGIASRVTHRQVIPYAAGGGFDEKSYDGHRLNPMSATQPRIVSPNTWRVIGDRAAGDEAFIPLVPGSASSQTLLEASAARMGRVLMPQGVRLTPQAMAPMAGGGMSAQQLAGLRLGSAAPSIVVRSAGGADLAGLRGDIRMLLHEITRSDLSLEMLGELRSLVNLAAASGTSATARAALGRDLGSMGAW